MLYQIVKALGDLELLEQVTTSGLLAKLEELETQGSWDFLCVRTISAAMSGDMVLVLSPPGLETVTAADLNAAAVGTLKRSFTTALQTAGSDTHVWASFAPVLTPSKTVADVDVGAPTVPPGLKFDKGHLLVEITFDTDAGATKTYAAGDSVAVQVQVKADDTLLDWPVSSVTKTYNVV